MAYIQERRDKDGKLISYSIRVHRGRGADGKQLKPFTATFDVKPTWKEENARKKAEAFAAQFERDCKKGTATDCRQTFEQYAEYVLALKERNGEKISSITDYRNMSARIYPIIGHKKLKDLQAKDLNDLYGELMKDGVNKRTGGKLSNKTVLRYHRFVSIVLSKAVKEGLIPFNPAARADPPKAEKREPESLQTTDIKNLINALGGESDKWRTIISLMLVTGMRRGEVAGLKWDCIDFAGGLIHVRNSITYIPGVGARDEKPKTENSIRSIPVPSDTMAMMRHWKESEMLRLKKSFDKKGYVFPQDVKYMPKEDTYIIDNRSPMHPDSITSWLTKFCKRHNLPHIHPHQLRHTYASQLIYAELDVITTSKLLGHSKPSTTTDIYSHRIAEADEKVRGKVTEIFLKKA